MPLDISTWAITEKNKVSQINCWLLALEITIPGYPAEEIARIIANNDDITWAGHLWQAFPFEIDEIGENSKGEVPRIDIRISNINQVMEYYIQTYDAFLKAHGYSAIKVKIMVINSGNLANTTPEVSYDFELVQPKKNSQWATFTLGASNPYRRRYPEYRILRNQCQYKQFGGIECGYVIPGGTTPACDRTLTACRTFNNSGRFGGFPGAGDGSIRL